MHQQVFPTCVGMNRDVPKSSTTQSRVPHMRGDEPIISAEERMAERCPHMRGDEPNILRRQERYHPCSPHAWG